MTHQSDHHNTGKGSDRYDRISRRAYELYVQRGGQHGADFDDWLAAEREMALHAEPQALTARVDADAGVLGAPAPGDVTTDGAPNAAPTPAAAAPAARKAASKSAAKTAAPKGDGLAKPAAKSAAKPATKTAAKQAAAAPTPTAPAPAAPAPAAPAPAKPAATKGASKRKPASGAQPPAGESGTA